MDWWSRFNQLQIDLTSHCNARCPGCRRNLDGGEAVSHLNLNHLDKNLIKTQLLEYVPKNKIRNILFNGSWGDSLMHPHILDILQDIIDSENQNRIIISTNGSLRNVEFFEDLAKLLRKFNNHVVQFAMDGLADTHSIYRRKTDWHKLVENIKTFTQAGGKAEIITTLFDYNINQVDQIEKLAEDLGCYQFKTRKTHTQNMQVLDKEIKYIISTDSAVNVKPKIVTFNKGRGKYSDSKNADLDTLSVINHSCPWYSNGEIQIDPWGNVFPCCFMGHMGSLDQMDMDEEELELLNDDHFKLADHNLNNNTIEQILNNYWFTQNLPNRLDNHPYKLCQQGCNVK